MTLVSINQLKLPVTFQEKFLAEVFRAIKSAESGVIIGPSGMGKTQLLDLIKNKTIQEHYLPATTIITIQIDVKSTSEENKNFLFETATQLPADGHLLIMIDNVDLDSISAATHSDFFHTLKTVRERIRPQTSVFLVCDEFVLDDAIFSRVSCLKSILMENVLYLPPLSPQDSMAFAQAIAAQFGTKPSPKILDQIVEISGGFPRIIKRLVKQGVTLNDPKINYDMENLAKFVIKNPNYPLTPQLAKRIQPKSTDFETIGKITFTSPITKQEFALAKVLIENPDQLVTREAMIEAVWQNKQYDVNEHALDQMLHRLRKKLESASPKCELSVFRGRGVKLIY